MDDDPDRTKRQGEIPTVRWVDEPHPLRRETIEPGQIFAGHYRIFDIKAGGMGRVYLAEDLDAQRRGIDLKVAIKSVADQAELQRLSPRYGTDEQYAHLLMRFRREAMLWVRLRKHDNIILAMMVIDVGAKPYLVMEYANGGDLRTWIEQQRIGIAHAVNFARQFCRGMQYAVSAAGIVHRDIKPANVLISGNGLLKIADFGLAKAFDPEILEWPWRHEISSPDGQASRLGGGTLRYMPPEQFMSLRFADTRSDVFSFGTMFFEMLTNERLFARRNAYERALREERLPLADELNPAIPVRLSEIVDRCLRYEPDERYASFDALADDLTLFDVELPGRIDIVPDEHQMPFTQSIAILGETYSLISLGEFEAAAIRAQDGIDIDPDNAEHWINKGKAVAELKDIEEAQRLFRRATALQPENAIAWANRAWMTLISGNADGALGEATHATRLDPGFCDAWMCRGMCEKEVGRLDDAVESLRWSSELDSGNWKTHANLGFVLTDMGRLEDGLAALKRAAAINPRDPLLLAAIGRASMGGVMVNRLAGPSNFWRCPNCRAILRKNETTSTMARNIVGTVTCGGCRRSYGADDVYGGRYDLPEVELRCPTCSIQLRGPEVELLGEPCPSCNRPLPRA
jgi:serine/threonine protein kinase